MKKGILSLLTWSLPFLLLAQTDTSHGINWVTGLTWEQVKQKAKAENKYIFVDAYATWCGPCKLMDKNVYTADSVGDLVNEKFLAVKVQMDKTAKDDEQVKLWYKDADSIKNQYHIEGYPTLLFLNPEGQVTDKQLGFKPLGDFITLIKTAIVPGKIYEDPYVVYRLMLSNYKHGMKEFDKYPTMIKMADKIGDTAISRQLTKELSDYAASLPPKERYSKERIEFWNNYTWLSNTRVFGFFYNDAKLINKAMNKKDYAESFVDKTIQHEIVLPFLKQQAKSSGIAMEGAYLTYTGIGPGLKPDTTEAEWQKLETAISAKYGKVYAKRNVLIAMIEWYKRHRNTEAVVKYTLIRLNRYPPDISDLVTTYMINEPAWDAFLSSNNKRILKGYVKWMRKVINTWTDRDNYIDTYANLLYKLGHKRRAITWEEKAATLVPKEKMFSATLEQMKRGEPTYINQGAIWKNTKKI